MKCGLVLFPPGGCGTEAQRSRAYAVAVGRKRQGWGSTRAAWLWSVLPERCHHTAWVRGRCVEGQEGSLGPHWERQDRPSETSVTGGGLSPL